MSLNETASGERLHIGFFGRRNAGKSSLVNAVTNQNMAVVSDVKGTTTDPVKKAMELVPLGAVVITDTPGFDDEGALGALRVEKTNEILAKTDIAVLVIDCTESIGAAERELIGIFKAKNIPYITAFNKADLLVERKDLDANGIYVSARTGENITELKDMIGAVCGKAKNEKRLVSDLLMPGDSVLLVIPIDAAAPKGRLIMPQQMTIRDILDGHCTALVCQPEEIEETLSRQTEKPKLVICDSQAFGRVAKLVPHDIMLTSFSILMARYKGELDTLVRGATELSKLRDGDRVLISEGCTHHRQCGDIGTVKLPAWIEKFTGAKPEYTFTSGGGFPRELKGYKLIIHCGGCMLNEREMKSRISQAEAAGVPIVNYGTAIARMHGILQRSLEPFDIVIQ
ncbi:MAG: [Clostridia bacterium]|nr:[FeFe] hydrogenase H-cluster maturation GTPase HydF [Clostridia bacterium]